MHGLRAVTLTAHLNALLFGRGTVAEAAAAVMGTDVAAHLVNPDGVVDLDPWRAVPLAEGLGAIARLEPERWYAGLPVPGALGSLRGPRPLNEAALETGEVVLASTAGVALVPFRVGPAVQWRILTAERPRPPASPYEADRLLREQVLSAGRALDRLNVAGGPWPDEVPPLRLPAGYTPRQRAAADRAARLLAACAVALENDGGSLSSYAVTERSTELRAVRDAAAQVLCATASWLDADRVTP